MTAAVPRILGMGYHLPEKIRTNDDPIFDWLKENNPNGMKLFFGYEDRHVLDDGQELIDIMLPAAEKAIANAGLQPSDIDLLIGDGSISKYRTPNMISNLHQKLGLGDHVWPTPMMNSFSQFASSIFIADALVRAGRAKYVLVAMGDNWTRYVNYRTPQSISAGDGAAACVVGMSEDKTQWTFVDQYTITDTSYYGSMYMAPEAFDLPPVSNDEEAQVYTHPFFQITELGIKGFTKFGQILAPDAVKGILKKHCLPHDEVCMVTHQASAKLMNYWGKQIAPGLYIDTLKKFANLVSTSVPLNIAWAADNVPGFTQDHLVTLCLGPDMHANAMLMQRNV